MIMNPNNPLLVYRKWFLALKLDIAELLSLEIFKSLCQFQAHDMDLRRTFERGKQNNSYSGLHAGRLIDLIDKLVFLNEAFTNQRTAVILLSTTTSFLQALRTELSQQAKSVQHKLFNSISIGDDQATEHCENELDLIDWAGRSQAEIWQSWIALIKNHFSYQAIHTYLITEFSKSNPL